MSNTFRFRVVFFTDSDDGLWELAEDVGEMQEALFPSGEYKSGRPNWHGISKDGLSFTRHEIADVGTAFTEHGLQAGSISRSVSRYESEEFLYCRAHMQWNLTNVASGEVEFDCLTQLDAAKLRVRAEDWLSRHRIRGSESFKVGSIRMRVSDTAPDIAPDRPRADDEEANPEMSKRAKPRSGVSLRTEPPKSLTPWHKRYPVQWAIYLSVGSAVVAGLIVSGILKSLSLN
jgi:hypothetical protein